jgi:3',5'-cyclic AMP phosphodiesterase CpdA
MWIAQISDPHLRPRGILYKGVVDPATALAAAVGQINELKPLPDLVLLTGDVVEEGHADEYAAAREILDGLRPRLLAIPGNHDERDAFRRAFGDHPHLPPDGPLHFVADTGGPVRIIGFDVTVPDHHHGEVDVPAIEWLADALSSAPHRPTFIMMHQPPLSCGVPYLDAYNCRGGDRLASLVARYPTVERILCGHVHRHMLIRFGGTLLCTAPSTATAIALHPQVDARPASFLEPPGFLLHHWRPEGTLTHLLPIGNFPGPYPFA